MSINLKEIYANKFLKTTLYFLVYAIILSGSIMVLMDWYVSPVLSGMNLVSDYLNNQSDNVYLDITQFDQDELVDDKVNEFKSAMEKGDDLELTLDKIMTDVNVIQEDGLKKLYSIVLYQFSPLITMFAVWYLHLKIWLWMSRKICNLLRLKNALHKFGTVTTKRDI